MKNESVNNSERSSFISN